MTSLWQESLHEMRMDRRIAVVGEMLKFLCLPILVCSQLTSLSNVIGDGMVLQVRVTVLRYPCTIESETSICSFKIFFCHLPTERTPECDSVGALWRGSRILPTSVGRRRDWIGQAIRGKDDEPG